MSSSIGAVGVDFKNPKKPVQYKKIYQYLNTSDGNIVEFAHQLFKSPGWHPDKNPSLQIVMPILLKTLKKLSHHTLFKKLQKIMISAFAKGGMGLQSPDQALHSLKKLASGEEVSYSEENIANFFGDAFLKEMNDDKNRQLEGNSTEASMTFIMNLLKLVDSENLTGSIQQEFSYCRYIIDLVTTILHASQDERKKMRQVLTEKVHRDLSKLKEGESILLPTGWKGTPFGHAILLKIQRAKDHGYEMLVFNTGGGIQHHEKVIGGNKTYYNPVIKFEGLTYGDLADRHFLDALFELRTEVEGFDSNDLYQGILSRFCDKQVSDAQLSKKFITPQRAGTCTMRVLMNYIKYYTPSIDYQRLHYQMDKKVLEESLAKYKKQLKQQPQLTKLLKMGAERFARRILKLEKGSVHPKTIRNALNRKDSQLPNGQAISNEEIREGLKVVNRVLKAVNGATSLPKRTHQAFQMLSPDGKYPDVSQTLREEIVRLESKYRMSPITTFGRKQPKPIHFPLPSELQKSTAKYLPKLVESSEKAVHSGEEELACIELTQALLDFPLESLPKDEKACKELYHLITRATNALFAASSVSYADRMVAVYRAFSIGMALINKLDPELVSYPISIRPLEILQKNFNSLSYFSDVQKKLDETLQFFQQHNQNMKSKTLKMFEFEKWKHKTSTDTNGITLPIPTNSAEFYYLNNIVENIPDSAWKEVDKEYKESVENVVSNGMTKEEFRISMLWLGSDKIPVEVLKQVEYFHSLNQFAMMTELMIREGKSSLKNISLAKKMPGDPLSPETFFKPEYKVVKERGTQTKYLLVQLGQKIDGTSEYRLKSKKKPAISFEPKMTYVKKYAPKWWPGNKRIAVPLPSRAEAHEGIERETSADQSLFSPYKDVNSSILEDDSTLLFHANIKPNLSTHLLKDFLVNHLDELQRPENRTWFKLSLFQHQSLASNLREEPLLAKQLLEAFDQAIKTTQWQLNSLSGRKKREKSGLNDFVQDERNPTLDKYLFLLDMKARLFSHISDLDVHSSSKHNTTVSLQSSSSNHLSASSNSSSMTFNYTGTSNFNTLSQMNDTSHIEILRSQLREVIRDEALKKRSDPTKNFLYASMILALTYESYPPKNKDECIELLKSLNLCSFELRTEGGAQIFITNLHLQDIKHLVYKTVSKNNELLFQFINHEHEILTLLLKELYGVSLSGEVKWKNHHPTYIHNDKKGNEYQVNLATGGITCNGIPLKGYQLVYEDEMYKQAFGDKPFSNAIISSNQNPVKYSIEDENGSKIHIYRACRRIEGEVCGQYGTSSSSSSDDDDYGVINGLSWGEKEQVVRIEKEIDGRLYVFIPESDLPYKNGEKKYSDWWPSFAKHPYHKNYSTWLSIDNKGTTNIKIIDIKSSEVVACLSKNGLLEDFSQSKPHVKNSCIDLSKMPMWSSFSQFEEPYYISAKESTSARTDGNVTVDFTRHRTHNGKMMRFTSKVIHSQNSVKVRLHWEQDPQWFISTRQEIVGYPELKRFLVLENGEGKRKVILPKLTYSHITSDCSHEEIDCMTIEVDSEGNLLPQTTYEFAYCAYLSLMNKQYEQAMVLLQEAHSLQRYSPETLRILGWIVISEDESPDHVPDALAVRMYALWLGKDNLFRNKLSSVSGMCSKESESLHTHYAKPKQWEAYWLEQAYWPDKESERSRFSSRAVHLYERYLSVRKAVSVGLRVDSTKKLAKNRPSLLHVDEEIQLIDELNTTSEQIKARYEHLLNSLSSKTVEVKPSSLFKIELSGDDEINHRNICSIRNIENTSNDINYKAEVERLIKLRTRPGGNNFLEAAPYLYQLALSDDERDRLFVADILRDCKCEQVTTQSTRDIKSLLQYMLVSPEAAKKIDEVKNKKISSYKKQKELKNVLKSIQQEDVNNKYAFRKTHEKVGIYPLTSTKESVTILSSENAKTLSVHLNDDSLKHFLDKQGAGSAYYKLQRPSNDTETTIPMVDLSRKYSQKRYAQLLVDYPEAVKQLSREPVAVLTGNSDQVVQHVDVLLEETETQYKHLEGEILKIAQKLPPKGSMERVKAKLALRGRKKEQVTFRDCILAFIQKNEHGYLKINTILNKNEIQQLHSLIGEYLTLKTNANHYKRIQSAQKKPEEVAKLLTITRQYEIAKHPELLAFEYFMGYTLRKDQVEDITDFIKKDNQGFYPNIFKQRMMGAGKTEVLGTLLALLKADGHHLSIMVAPRSLYITNAQDIKRRSNNIFGQKATTINFSRSPSDFSVGYLAYIKRQLTHAIEDRNFVILPPESLQALENRYFEARDLLSKKHAKLEELKNNKSSDQYVKELEIATLHSEIQQIEKPTQLLKSILLLIKQRGVITFDEVDAVLQVRKELNFPIGASKKLPPHTCDLLKELFMIAATDSDILKLGLDLRGNRQNRMKNDDYSKIKPLLGIKICHYLARTPEWKERLAPIFKALSKGKHPESSEKLAQKLYEFIIDPDNESIDLHKIHAINTEEAIHAVELVTLLKQQINEWLSLAWKKRADEHYGLSKHSSGPSFAIPYIANNTPNENAQFADPWEMVNRTLQVYIHKGLRDEQVEHLFRKLKQKAEHEWVSSGEPMDVRALPVVNKILEATGYNIMELDGSDLREFTKRLNSGTEKALRIVLDYVVEEILPTYEQFTEQVTNNSHNLSSIGQTLQGYSGTLENIDTLAHERVEVALDNTAKAKILNTLIKENNDRVTVIDDKVSLSSIMDSILYNNNTPVPEAGKFKALIDIGPLFTGISSEKVAMDIAEYFHKTQSTQLKEGVKGVIFWDDKTNLMKFIRCGTSNQVITLPNTDSSTIQSVTGLKKEELFFYYSHSRITGANAKLQEDAIAVVTFDSQTPIRNWLQGVMRMRQIWQEQRIVTVVPRGVVEVIAKKTGQTINTNQLTIQNLVPFADDNESCLQEVNILKSVKQKLQNAARQFVMKQMLIGDSQKERALFDDHRSLFVRTLSKSMYSRFSGKKAEQQKLKFIEFLLQKYFSKILTHNEIQSVFQKCSSSSNSSNNTTMQSSSEKSALIAELRTIVRKNIDNLPDKVDTNISSAWGQESLVVQQQQQTMQQEVNQEQQQEQEQEQEVNLELYSMNGRECQKRTEVKWQLNDVRNSNFPVLSPAAKKNQEGTTPVVWSLNDFLKHSEKFNHYAQIFDDSVCVTRNFLNTFNNVSNFLDRYQKPLYEVVAIYQPTNEKQPWKIMMVSLEEASQFKEFTKELDRNKPPYFMVLEPNAEVVKSGNFTLTNESRDSLMKAILPVLVLSGDMRSLSKAKWRPYINRWVQSNTYLKKNFVEFNALPGKGQQKDLYEHSYLKNMLETYSKGFSPDAELQYQTILSLTEHDMENKGLELLVQFVKSNDLENENTYSKCMKLVKAYTSNAILFELDKKDNHNLRYNYAAGNRWYVFTYNTQKSENRNLYFQKTKFNFYPIIEKLLDLAVKQARNGKFEYAQELIDLAGPLSDLHFYSKLETLIDLLIESKQFAFAKKLIEPSIKIYTSDIYERTIYYFNNIKRKLPDRKIPFLRDFSKNDPKILKKYYDRFLEYKSYLRLFRWMIALNDAGGTDQAQQIKEMMKEVHKEWVNRFHYSHQEQHLPAFYRAAKTVSYAEHSKDPQSPNIEFLGEFFDLSIKTSKEMERYKMVDAELKKFIAQSKSND